MKRTLCVCLIARGRRRLPGGGLRRAAVRRRGRRGRARARARCRGTARRPSRPPTTCARRDASRPCASRTTTVPAGSWPRPARSSRPPSPPNTGRSTSPWTSPRTTSPTTWPRAWSTRAGRRASWPRPTTPAGRARCGRVSDPYPRPGQSPEYLRAVRHVQEVLFLPQRTAWDDNAAVKWAVMTYGGVDAAAYFHYEPDARYWNGAHEGRLLQRRLRRAEPPHPLRRLGRRVSGGELPDPAAGTTARSSSRTAGARTSATRATCGCPTATPTSAGRWRCSTASSRSTTTTPSTSTMLWGGAAGWTASAGPPAPAARAPGTRAATGAPAPADSPRCRSTHRCRARPTRCAWPAPWRTSRRRRRSPPARSPWAATTRCRWSSRPRSPPAGSSWSPCA